MSVSLSPGLTCSVIVLCVLALSNGQLTSCSSGQLTVFRRTSTTLIFTTSPAVLQVTGTMQDISYNTPVTSCTLLRVDVGTFYLGGLLPGHAYNFVVQLDSCPPITMQQATVPDPPTSFTRINATSSSLLVTWSASNGSVWSSFTLSGTSEEDRSDTFLLTNVTMTIVVIPRLTPGASYTISLSAVSNGLSSSAVSATFTVAPLKPLSLVLTGVTSNTISISWQPATGVGYRTSFTVAYYSPVDLSTPAFLDNLQGTSYTIRNLLSSVNYQVWVMAAISGVFSDPVYLDVVTKIRLINQASVTDITMTSLVVTWSTVTSSSGSAFTLTYYPSAYVDDSHVIGDITGSSCTITDLLPGTGYTIVIRVDNSTSADSYTLTATTEPISNSLFTVSAVPLNASSLLISWTVEASVQTYIQSFSITFVPNFAGVPQPITVGGAERSLEIQGLTYYVSYLVYIRFTAANISGDPISIAVSTDAMDCYGNSCWNQQTCVDELNSFMCVCNDSYTGSLCNIDTTLSSSECHNGTFTRVKVNNTSTAKCACPQGVTGTYCEQAACPDQPNGPHDITCLQEAWRMYCYEGGVARPPLNTSLMQFWNSVSLSAVRANIRYLMTAANDGDSAASLQCYGPTSSWMRLSNGPSASAGRLEIMRSGVWGTVCDDRFDDTSAGVTCSLLGYSGGQYKGSAYYGPGAGPVWMTDVQCVGGEQTLFKCSWSPVTYPWSSCDHTEDVSVICRQESSSDTWSIGSNATKRGSSDIVTNAVIIPDFSGVFYKPGNVTGWRLYSTVAGITIYLQIWRLNSVSRFEEILYLAGQTRIISTVGFMNVTLNATNQIAVQQGDFLGIYFPTINPIPWDEVKCTTSDDLLRYVVDPGDILQIGDQLSFDVAPYAFSPCRQYSASALVVTRSPPEPPANNQTQQIPAVTLPPPLNGTIVFQCDFEVDLCTMVNSVNDYYDWVRARGPQLILYTGPSSAISGSYYLLADANEYRFPGYFAVISLPAPLGSSSDAILCLSFYYSMFGDEMGSLAVLLYRNNNSDTAWLISGDQGNAWHLAFVNISGEFQQIQFISTRGGLRSSIAIDDVFIFNSFCPDINSTDTYIPQTTTISPQSTTASSIDGGNSTIYVTATGRDIVNCGSQTNPCSTLQYAISQRPTVKSVVLTVASHLSTTLDLSTLGSIVNLTLTSTLTSGDLPVVRFVGSNPVPLSSLHISGVTATGDLLVMCASDILVFNMSDVTYGDITMATGYSITVSNCPAVLATINRVTFYSTVVYMTVTNVSDISFMNSTFNANNVIELYPVVQNSGAIVDMVGSDGRHAINVDGCVFIGCAQHWGLTMPSAALVILSRRDTNQLKFGVTDSVFSNNIRAIDASLKGWSDISIVSDSFVQNSANGSGGAVRFTATINADFGSLTILDHTAIYIDNCTFDSNQALASSEYKITDMYFASRSPSSGGAMYCNLNVRSPLDYDGLVTVVNSVFTNNTANIQGGVLYFDSGISAYLADCLILNEEPVVHSRFGEILRATNNMTLERVTMTTITTAESPIVFYEASDSYDYRLLVANVTLMCPAGHRLQLLNTSSLSLERGLNTLQISCLACDVMTYSLIRPQVTLFGSESQIQGSVNCSRCPYGALCQSGVWNLEGFWGELDSQSQLDMYMCPQGYCTSNLTDPVFYTSCDGNRTGTLCGRCADGFSEALFDVYCVPDDQCGMQNWPAILIFIAYGIFYLLFFMFEPEWSAFLKMLARKAMCGHVKANNESATEGGFLPIFLYFIQVIALLRVSIVFDTSAVYQVDFYRPSDILPTSMMESIQNAFSSDVISFYQNMCFFPGVTPVIKTGMQLAFVGYIFLLLLLVYVFSGFCLICKPKDKRPHIGRLTLNGRVLLTLTSLFLYTYENIAENAMSIINCIQVGNQTVLFIDGNVQCPQPWQGGVILLNCCYVFPFFIVLFVAPHLLDKQVINLPVFYISFVLPLFAAIPLILLFIREARREKRTAPYKKSSESERIESSATTDIMAQSASQLALIEMQKNGAGLEQGDRLGSIHSRSHSSTHKEPETSSVETPRTEQRVTKETDSVIAESLNGPYREDILYGACWEGMMNFRRLTLVAAFTFINNILLRQLALSLACFVFLVIQIRVQPFRQYLANQFENISLSLLVIIAVINIVKAALYVTQTIPAGPVYVCVAIEEWIEDVCILLLPILVLIFVILALISASRNRVKHAPVPPASDNHSQSTRQASLGSNLRITYPTVAMVTTPPCSCYTCKSSNYTMHTVS